MASTVGQMTGPPAEKLYAVEPGRRRHDDAVAAEGRQRAPVDLHDDLEHALTTGLLDRRLVQRPGLVDDGIGGILDPHLQREPLFDRVVARDDPPDRIIHVVALDLGEEAHVSHVDAEYRRGALAHELGRTEDRPVATQHDREFDLVQRHVIERRDVARTTSATAASSARSSGASTGRAPAARSASTTRSAAFTVSSR